MTSSINNSMQIKIGNMHPIEQSSHSVKLERGGTESQASSTSSAVSDTVSISSAATAALQEATETQTQTAQEARSGDMQAQRLLAKEQVAAKAAER